MRIVVMGAGGMGGCLGAHLAKAGNDVTLIARSAHLEAIRRNGLRLKTHDGEFTVDTAATDDPGEVGSVDLVELKCWRMSDEGANRKLCPH